MQKKTATARASRKPKRPSATSYKRQSSKPSGRPLQRPKPPIEIDWRPFSNGRDADRFEDMAVELFVAVHGENAFTPNARRRGRDGGVDGLFDSTIGKVGGPWKVAVAVRQTFAEAKKKVIHENKLAREAGQRALFFITSYDATAVETSKLTALARSGLKGACVWARAKLERLLRDHPWIRQVYFGHQLVSGMVPVAHPSELDDPGQPDLELVGRATERAQVRAFVEGAARIAVVVAAGGAGKTRLLRAMPELAWGTRPRRSVWLRRVGQGAVDDAFLNGLPVRKPMMIVLDDAAQALSELAELARLAVDTSAVDIKLVLSIRTVDREAIARALSRVRILVTWIELGELPVADAARIAKLECVTLSAGDADRLARAFGSNLFLLRAAAQEVCCGEQPGAVVNNENIRRLVATRQIEDAERHLASIIEPRHTLRVLSEAALNAPLPLEDATQNVALATLLHAGILRRVGETVRFRRDIEGDLLLAYLVELPGPRVIIERSFIEQEIGDGLQRKLRNLSAAGRGYAATMIRDLMQRWSADPGSHAHRIRLLPYCAEAAPQQVAEMALDAAHARELTADDVASIAAALGRSDAKRSLRLVWELAALDAATMSFSVHDVITRLLNPCFHGPDELTACCGLLEGWVGEQVFGRRDEVLADAVSALLTTVATWDTYDGAAITLHEQPLPASPRLLAIRRAACRMVGTMLGHPQVSMRRRGAALLDRHGAPHLGRVSSTRAFHEAAAAEFQDLVPIIESRFAEETEIDILASIYTSLATRWAAGWPGSTAAGQILRGKVIAPNVKAYHYSSRKAWFYSFDEIFEEAPENDRWSWWVHRYLHNRSDVECARVVSDLCARHYTVTEVARVAAAIADAERPEWIVDGWCCCEPALFEQALPLVSNERARRVVENAIWRDRYRRDPHRVLTDMQALPQPASLDDVNLLLHRASLNDVELALALGRALAAQADVAVRRRGLDCVQHRDDADAGKILGILENALRDGDWGQHWDVILYMIDKPDRRAVIGQHPALVQRIEDRFVVGKDWIGDAWHEERVLEILYGDDHARRLDLMGCLLEKGTYGAAQEVGRLLAPLLLVPETFRCVVDRLIVWARARGDAGLDTVEHVLEGAPLREPKFPGGMQEFALELLKGGDSAARGVALLLLSELCPDAEVCATLARIAADSNDTLQSRAASALRSYRWPRRGWSRSIGEPPPKLADIGAVLRRALPGLTGDARGLVVELARQVEQEIAGYARKDEEVLLPR